jgi:hypothetical protein
MLETEEEHAEGPAHAGEVRREHDEQSDEKERRHPRHEEDQSREDDGDHVFGE